MALEAASSSRQKRVALALLIGFIAEFINKICPLITLSVAQKRLGLGSLGSALFGLSILEITLPLVMFGYTYYGALQLPRLADDRVGQSRLVSQIVWLRLGHAALTALGLFAAAQFITSWAAHRDLLYKLLPFLFIAAFDMTFFNFGQQRMARLSFWVGGFKLLNLIAVLLLVQSPDDGHLFALLMIGASAGVSVASAIWMLPRIGLHLVPLQDCWNLLKKASGLAVVVFLYPLYERFDILVAEKIQDAELLGSYIAPWRLVMSLVPIFMVIATTFLSENIAARDQKAVEKGSHYALFLSLILTFPVCVAAPFLGGDILAFVFDDSLRDAAPLFTIFTASILAEVFVCILGMQILLLRRDLVWLAMSMGTGILVGSLGAYALQDSHGAIGNAMGAVLGRILTVGIICYRIPSILRSLPWRDYLAIPVGAVVMGLSLIMMPDSWHVLIRIMLGGMVYLAALGALLWKQLTPLLQKVLRRPSGPP
ncbi:lipopolysaccharide biosynthesis protein [Oligoflexus tunisiensis]|uniref:lipopolysaccharide biosynthesis protein n=1 Tax=Oligoflexus tunisiensis TaxID=708132 RepID=UPI00114CB976|nr:hypothetical protein [Oligoflexus tunisiensis]